MRLENINTIAVAVEQNKQIVIKIHKSIITLLLSISILQLVDMLSVVNHLPSTAAGGTSPSPHSCKRRLALN